MKDNRMSPIRLIPHMLWLLILLGCSGSDKREAPTSLPRPLATVGEIELGVGEFTRRLSANPLAPPLEIVEQWSREAVLLVEAYQRELHLRPQVIERSRRAVEQVLLTELEQELTAGIKQPDHRAVKRWWDRHYHSFRVNRPMMRGHLFSHSDPDSAARIRELLLGKVSEEWIGKQMPTLRIHDSGFIYREELREELAAFLFDSTALVSAVIPVGASFFVVKRIDEREADHHFNLVEVEEEIRARLLEQERTRSLSAWKARRYQEIDLLVDTMRLVATAESLFQLKQVEIQ
ncbi:MAG: hypothetical protein ISR91_03775 [Candidatus Delongbacteria bacterium]|nr:hypothetical protein [Candidatus Delongbacteria bacterium]